MSILPFLSATKEDLDADCRPGVIDSVRIMLGQEPVTMETWDTNYEDPIVVCRKKIADSSHYIGIFAYRRGWVPALLKKSITEAEFEWAVELKKTMVVFLPNPTTPFARQLRERAKGQSESDADEQTTFRKRVMQEGTYQPFDDALNLVNRTSRTLNAWQNSLRGVAQPVPSSRKTPTEDDINQLGRKQQSRQIEDVLDILVGSSLSSTVCFLIHGPGNHGHKQLASRLRKELEARSPMRQYEFSLGPLWRQPTAARLIEILGAGIKPQWTPASNEELADGIREALINSDVVMEIDRIDRLPGSLITFVDEFWRPLVLALSGPLPHRLTVLATLEQSIQPGSEQYLQPPPKEDALAFDAAQLVRLQPLEHFTEQELTIWLRKGEWVESAAAEPLAQALINDSIGGMPQLLYSKLSDDTTWIL